MHFLGEKIDGFMVLLSFGQGQDFAIFRVGPIGKSSSQMSFSIVFFVFYRSLCKRNRRKDIHYMTKTDSEGIYLKTYAPKGTNVHGQRATTGAVEEGVEEGVVEEEGAVEEEVEEGVEELDEP